MPSNTQITSFHQQIQLEKIEVKKMYSYIM